MTLYLLYLPLTRLNSTKPPALLIRSDSFGSEGLWSKDNGLLLPFELIIALESPAFAYQPINISSSFLFPSYFLTYDKNGFLIRCNESSDSSTTRRVRYKRLVYKSFSFVFFKQSCLPSASSLSIFK
jgi:hypothetical protein